MTVGKFRALRQELGDGGELVCIETFQQRGHVFSYRDKYAVDLSRTLHVWVKELPTLVLRVRFTTQKSSSLQPCDHTGHCSRGQASDRGQFAGGDRLSGGDPPTFTQQIEALMVRWTQPQTFSNSLMKQHHRSAVSSRQPPDDLFDQLLIAFARSFHLASSLSLIRSLTI